MYTPLSRHRKDSQQLIEYFDVWQGCHDIVAISRSLRIWESARASSHVRYVRTMYSMAEPGRTVERLGKKCSVLPQSAAVVVALGGSDQNGITELP